MSETPNTPFNWSDAEPRGRLARLARGIDYDAASRGVANLFVDYAPEAVTDRQLSEILDLHGVRPARRESVLTSVYSMALKAFLVDSILSAEELQYLRRLKTTLALTEEQCTAALAALVEPAFAAAVSAAADDRELTDQEIDSLERLGTRLGLSDAAMVRIRADVTGEVAKRALDAALKDGKFTPSEEAAVIKLAKQLQLSVTFSGERVERARLLGGLDEGVYPEVSADIALQRGETCHFQAEARWAELRTVTTRVNYSGTSVSIPIIKGVRYRIGSVSPERVTREELRTLDEGSFYITSKRVLFRGAKGNKQVPLSQILCLGLYKDGLRIEKASGRSPYVLFDGDTELAAAVLSARLSDA